MTHDAIHELIAAYALDSIDHEDLHSVERTLIDHLASCEDCRLLYAELREVAGDLALASDPITMPPRLENAILHAAGGTGTPNAIGSARSGNRGVRAAIAALLAAVLSLSGLSVYLSGEARDDDAERSTAREALALFADPGARVATLEPAGVTGSVRIALGVDGKLALVGLDLPQPPEGKIMELWLLDEGTPVAVAVFSPREALTVIEAKVAAAAYDAAAITFEPAPDGSHAPTSDMIYAGSLSTRKS